ncbi:exodeoxyribonuclease VII small subunit [Natronospora cellulosivora (SeqCode)]
MADSEMKFEKAVEDLEKIVEELEDGGLALDKSLDKFTEGIKLIKYCNQELNKAEKKIEMVVSEDGSYSETIPFEDKEEKD